MRCGFDQLAVLGRIVIGQGPSGCHLFIFRSRGGDRLKTLYWDRDGYALWYKRPEAGTFRLHRADDAASIELPASFGRPGDATRGSVCMGPWSERAPHL